MLDLNSNIQYIKGVGEKKAGLFNKLGIFCVRDLIEYYPRAYEDRSVKKTVDQCESGETACIEAAMVTPVKEHYVRKGMTLYKCDFSDGKTVIHVTIFNNKYLAAALKLYENYILFGSVERTLTSAKMSSPEIEKAENSKVIRPIYSATGKLNSKAIEKVVKTALENTDKIVETLPAEIRLEYKLVSLDFAVRQIHCPENKENLEKARRRLIFEELLTLQLGLLKLKSRRRVKTQAVIQKDFSNEFYKLLPFSPTGAQKRAINECCADMASGYPMNRLLQGDVGSGKTAVAAGIIYTAVKNGWQCALMAPTEILAQQHFQTLCSMLENTGIRIQLLTGSTPKSEKRIIKEALIDGETDLIIGTHALIQNDVEFSNLGLVITDEQHRFGVNQRANLAMKGSEVHTLVMSATPIPRTLALMIYGDLDISVLDELPPGRQTIRTDVVDSRYHKRIYAFIKKQIESGNQAYIVCPLVDESETENMVSAEEYAEELSKNDFSGINIGLLHGKMKPAQQDNVMNAFAAGDIKLLVATTVIEVGVDVPSATVIVIENAERFGLSQLHQLRGRVGRGKEQSYCILVSDSKSETARQRLKTMKDYSDGFKIADVDLKLRGPGDFFGNRQHGLPKLKIADMLEDIEVLKECRRCADGILSEDFNLDKPEYKALANSISDMFRNSVSN